MNVFIWETLRVSETFVQISLKFYLIFQGQAQNFWLNFSERKLHPDSTLRLPCNDLGLSAAWYETTDLDLWHLSVVAPFFSSSDAPFLFAIVAAETVYTVRLGERKDLSPNIGIYMKKDKFSRNLLPFILATDV